MDIASLIQKQKVSPIMFWEATVGMLDQWAVFLAVIFGPADGHPAFHEI